MIWGDIAFRRPEGNGWRDQTLAGMYDAQMLAADQLSSTEFGKIIKRIEATKLSTVKLFNDTTFDQAVRTATNTPSRIKYRIAKVLAMLKANAR